LNYKAQISDKSSPKEYCTWLEVEMPVKKLHTIQTSGKKYDVVLAITNGGIIPARLMARELDINHIQFILIRNKRLHIEEMVPLLKGRKYLVVDDIHDTGDTFTKVFNIVKKFDSNFISHDQIQR
jgi:uncharacterized protein